MSFHDHDPDGPFLRVGKNPAPRLLAAAERISAETPGPCPHMPGRLTPCLECERGTPRIPVPFEQPPSRATSPSPPSPPEAGPKPGDKYDGGKPRYDLIPFKALHEVVLVLTFGAKKYAPDGWRSVPGWRWRYFGAAMRHLVSWFGGEVRDPESGLHHLAHAACCVLFMLELDAAEK